MARSSGSAPPSSPKAGAERSQNVTGPRLSAPKRDPPPGDRDAGGRSLPFLSQPAQSSFILQAGSRSSPAGHSCTANPPDALSGAWPETRARIRARAQTPLPRTWRPPDLRAFKAFWIPGSEARSRSPVVGDPRRALRRVPLGIQDREMCIPVPPSLQLETPARPPPSLKNTRFFLLLGDRDPAPSEGREHPGPRPPARAAPPALT